MASVALVGRDSRRRASTPTRRCRRSRVGDSTTPSARPAATIRLALTQYCRPCAYSNGGDKGKPPRHAIDNARIGRASTIHNSDSADSRSHSSYSSLLLPCRRTTSPGASCRMRHIVSAIRSSRMSGTEIVLRVANDLAKRRRMSQSIRRVLSPCPVAPARVATIPLRRTLPHASSGLPGSSGGPPSNAPCLTLLRVGFTEPHRSPGALVVSCTTVSP